MQSTANRELRSIQTINAPADLLWQTWTDPEHIIHWWGPKGFTTTIHEMDIREGGEWKLTLHGPDGKNYPNRSVYKEIVPLKKIVFEHFNPGFTTIVTFEPKGDQTEMDWTLLFETEEMRDIVVKAHKAEEGQKQNIERLESYLSELKKDSFRDA